MMEQRVQSQTRLSYAESRQNSTKVKSQGIITSLWDFFRIFAASSVILVILSKIWVVPVPQNRRTFAVNFKT